MVFKAMTRNDWEIIVVPWFDDRETRRRLGGMQPLEHFFNFASRQPGRYLWLVYEGEDAVGLVDFDTQERPVSFAYLVAPGRRKCGIGSRILQALLARPEFPSGAIEVGVEQDNAASLRCLYHAGFTIPDPTPDEDGFLTLVRENPGAGYE